MSAEELDGIQDANLGEDAFWYKIYQKPIRDMRIVSPNFERKISSTAIDVTICGYGALQRLQK